MNNSSNVLSPMPAAARRHCAERRGRLNAAGFHATRIVPIVALDVDTDPLRSGLVSSPQRPRTNVTGLFLDPPASPMRGGEFLQQAMPQAQMISLLWDASTGPWQLAAAKAAVQAQRFDVDPLVAGDETFARFARVGRLMPYSQNVRGSPLRVAVFVGKILRDMKPSDMPFGPSTAFDLPRNPKAARAPGLKVPPSVRVCADEFAE